MITKVRFILTVNVADGKYVFAYEGRTLDQVLDIFWHTDYYDTLSNFKDGGGFLIDVLEVPAALGGKVLNTYKVGFNACVFHHYYDKGWKCNEKGERITYTLDEFHKDLIKVREDLEREEKYDNKATSLFFYMWNCWCEEECKKAFADGDYNHFWKKWCGITEEHGRFGSVEHFYAELSNNNRDKLVRRACEMFDGSCEKY